MLMSVKQLLLEESFEKKIARNFVKIKINKNNNNNKKPCSIKHDVPLQKF